MKKSKTILKDIKSGKAVKLPKVHGNTKVRNIITGKRDMTLGQWRRAAQESATHLINALHEPDWDE